MKPKTPPLANQYLYLGIHHHSNSELQLAISYYRQAIAHDPSLTAAYNNLAAALGSDYKTKESIELLKKAITIDPNYYPAYCNLGNMYRDLGQYDLAYQNYQSAILLKPNYFEAHLNLAQLCFNTKDYVQAEKSFREVLKLEPQHEQALVNLAVSLKNQGQPGEAVKLLNQAISLKPDLSKAHYQLALITHSNKKIAEAIEILENGLKQIPDHPAMVSYLATLYRHSNQFTKLSKLEPKLAKQTNSYIKSGDTVREGPGQNLSRSQDLSLNLAVAQNWSNQYQKQATKHQLHFKHQKVLQKGKLHIGYLSADFTNHATTHLIVKLYDYHSRKSFYINSLSHGSANQNPHRNQIENISDEFTDLSLTSNPIGAQKIHQQHINILVDLKGHTADSRIELAAFKPAPIQITWLGYPGTSGASFIDYVITDPIVTPPNHQPFYSENFLTLPHTYQVNSFTTTKDPIQIEDSKPKSTFVLAVINLSYKITKDLFLTWIKVLKKNPSTKLLLFYSNDLSKKNLLALAKQHKLDLRQIEFTPKLPYHHHIRRFASIDLSLDPSPINGHTSTSEALWACTPVLTLLGNHFASRVSASLLSALGLTELVTHSLADYYSLALSLAQNPAKLKRVNEKLIDHRLTYPLFDTPRFTTNLESAYFKVWDTYLQGKSPIPTSVVDPYPLDNRFN